jgi:hypothetical protein
MEDMRTLLRGSLGESLRAMREEDRLAAAWHVVCGKTMADRGCVVGYADGVVRVEVGNAAWLRQMMSMNEQLTREIGRISGVKVREIHFESKKKDVR